MRQLLLRLVLAVFGLVCCLSGLLIVLPGSWFEEMVGWFVGEEAAGEIWPTGPMFDYLLRVSMAAYLWIGVVLLVAAGDPEKQKAQIDVAVGMLVVLAVVTLTAGLLNGLPWSWFLGDAIPCAVAALLIGVLRPRKAKS